MQMDKNIKLNEITYFLNDKLSDTINDEKDLKKHVKLNMKCVSKSYLDNKPEYAQEYIKSLLSINMESNNTTILYMNSSNEENKRKNSVDIAVAFAALNKKVLLIVTSPGEYEWNNRIDIRNHIKTTSFKNIEIFENLFGLEIMKDIIVQLKKIYDVIIVDTLSSTQINNSISLLTVVDYITLVVNSGETKIKDFKKIYKTAIMTEENSIGIVLNEKNRTQTYNIQIKTPPKKITIGVYDKKLYKRQNKYIRELKKDLVELEKKVDNDKIIKNAINKQNDVFKQKLLDNNKNLKKIIEKKDNNNNKMIKENTEKIMQEMNNIKSEMNRIVISMQEDMKKLMEQKTIEMEEEYKQGINNIREGIQAEYEQMAEETRQQIENTKNEIREEYKQEIENTRQGIGNVKEELKAEYQQEICNIREGIQTEYEQMAEETRQQIENTKNEIREECKQEIENTRQGIENVKEELKVEYQHGIEETRQEIRKEIQSEYQQELKKASQEIEEIRQELKNTKNEIQREYKDYVKKAKVKKKNNDLKKNKTTFSLDEDISYESLERSATYVISIEDGTIKEFPSNWIKKYIFSKHFL